MREPMPGGGFAVDPATLTGVAGQLGTAYDDLNTAFGDILSSSSADASVFGDPDVAGPWGDFCSDYFAEVQEDVNALSELIEKLLTTAQRYQETEADVTGSVTGAGAG